MSGRPKRKKKSRTAKIRPFWFLLLLVGAALGFGAYYAATWPGFFPHRIAVSGNHRVPAALILSRAQISESSNLWLQNMHAASARVQAIPEIGDAGIRRSLPAGVRISVTERVPYAVIRSGSTEMVVDRDLRVLRRTRSAGSLPVFVLHLKSEPADGVFLKDERILHLRDDYDTLADAHVIVTSLQYDKYGDLVAGMRSGVRLLLGDDTDLPQKAALIGPILSQVAAGGRRIAAVDLRAVKTPVVVYK